MANSNKKQSENKELNVLGTHAAGATDLFETRMSSKTVSVEPPKHPGGVGND